jgi:hypothetical protein
MKERIGEFKLSLHGVREDTKDVYLAKMEWFGSFLAEQGIKQFGNVDKKDIDVFLSNYNNPNTKNLFIQVFRSAISNIDFFGLKEKWLHPVSYGR